MDGWMGGGMDGRMDGRANGIKKVREGKEGTIDS